MKREVRYDKGIGDAREENVTREEALAELAPAKGTRMVIVRGPEQRLRVVEMHGLTSVGTVSSGKWCVSGAYWCVRSTNGRAAQTYYSAGDALVAAEKAVTR